MTRVTPSSDEIRLSNDHLLKGISKTPSNDGAKPYTTIEIPQPTDEVLLVTTPTLSGSSGGYKWAYNSTTGGMWGSDSSGNWQVIKVGKFDMVAQVTPTISSATVSNTQDTSKIANGALPAASNLYEGVILEVTGAVNITPTSGPLLGLDLLNTGDLLVCENVSGVRLWKKIDNTDGSNSWSLTGNVGTTPLTNFLGTTDTNTILGIKTGNLFRNLIYGSSFVVGSNTDITNIITSLLPINSGISTLNNFNQVYVHSNTIQSSGFRTIRRGGTLLTPTLPPTNGILGFYNMQAYTGTADINVASMVGYIEGTPTATSIPTEIRFATTPTGSTTQADRMYIKSTGNVGFGIAAPTSTVHVNGSKASSIVNITATTTLNATNHKVLVNNGATNITITLPDALTCIGREYVISRGSSSTGTITVVGSGTNQIQALVGTIGATTSISAHGAVGLGLNTRFTAINIAGVGTWVRI